MAAKKNVKGVLLEIEPGNVISAPDPFRCHPDDNVAFVVINNDGAVHWVFVDAAKIVLSEDGTTSAVPLTGGKHFVKVKPGEIDLIKGHQVKDASQFGKTKSLQYTSYKYTIDWADDQNGTNNKSLDPDFDVTP